MRAIVAALLCVLVLTVTATSLQTSERKPVVVPVSSEKVVALAKDWMAGGTAAGISKTIVAPIGEELAPHSFTHTPTIRLL